MITARSITGGGTYLAKHLRANDYYSEGEQIEGEWIGKGAAMLGLEGAVEEAHFEALRANQHPFSGKRLTARQREGSIRLHDITFSAPKAASIAAIVGEDSRIVEAWRQSVRLAVTEMERFAAVRLRTGEFAKSEKLRVTGNVACALFFHDSSRTLDPHLHAHAVMANASYDKERGQWLALQRRAMLEASPYVREFLYHDFARRMTRLGYEIEPDHRAPGFRVAGITREAEELFSARARQRQDFVERYEETFGHRPSKRRVEQFIKEDKGAAEARFRAEYENAFGRLPDKAMIEAFVVDWRDRKLTEISTPEVRLQQRERLGADGFHAVSETVRAAHKRAAKGVALPTGGSLKEATKMGLDHCLERSSVVRVGDALAAALRFGSKHMGDLDPRGLYDQLHAQSGAISDGYQMTTEQVLEEEARILRFADRARGRFTSLGDASGAQLDLLDGDQRQAVEALCRSRAGIAVLIGDAGTGKTHALARLDEARRRATGSGLIALAPTTRATAELQKNGYPEAATVAAFLASDRLQEGAADRAILIDEAGFLSTRQLAELVRVAEERQARLVLVGDTKQHESVERGSALRSLIDSKLVRPERLSKVRRQRDAAHRRIAKLLANCQSLKALEAADAAGMVREIPDARELFANAAKHYADSVEAGRETLVVIPTWADIDWFNEEARAELKARALIRGSEIEVRGSASLSWTEVERCHWPGYEPGMALNFHRAAAGMNPGETATVREVLDNGITVERPDGTTGKVTRKQRGAFDVAEQRQLEVAAGDELLFRANCPAIGVSNGERLRVASVDPDGQRVTLANGQTIPENFTQFSHGHAVTSHKSQGASVDESILVVGPHSLGATNLRQFYVSNTRFKHHHRLYAHDLGALKEAVANRSERMLAHEFVASLGKELGTLLDEAEKARAKNNPSASEAVAAKQREARIKELLSEVAKHERRAKTVASFNAFWSQLGGRFLPERIRKWIKGRRTRRVRQQRRDAARLYAVARGIRKSHQVGGWFRRARAKVRVAGRRL